MVLSIIMITIKSDNIFSYNKHCVKYHNEYHNVFIAKKN